MKYLRAFIIITFAAGILVNSPSIIDVVFMAISVALMLLITKQYSLKKNIGKYVILLTYWISLAVMPSFHLVVNQIGDFGIAQDSYDRLLSFGSKILLITTLAWVLFGSLGRRNIKSNFVYHPHVISKQTIKLSFVFIFGLSLFSYAIGLSRMGADQVELPFHLSGIITLLRLFFFPYLFAAYVENFILRNKKFPTTYYILYFIWALLEVFVRLSKGALVTSFLPVMLILFVYYQPNLKTIVRTLLPFIMVVLFLYPIIEIMRASTGSDIRESFTESRSQVNIETRDRLLIPLNRAFMIPQIYAKDYRYINDDKLFDFSKAPIVIAWKGAARYQTFVIDDYQIGVNHSSGTTGIQDPLLHGGYGLCYVVVFILMIAAIIIDTLIAKKLYSIYLCLIIILQGFCNSQNISTFYDSIGLQSLFAHVIVIWLAYYLNFRRKTVYPVSK